MANKYFKPAMFILCLAYVAAMHWFDVKVIGVEITFTLLYLIPISLVAWFAGIYYGVIIGFLCSLSWLHVYFVDKHIMSFDDLEITNIVLNSRSL